MSHTQPQKNGINPKYLRVEGDITPNYYKDGPFKERFNILSFSLQIFFLIICRGGNYKCISIELDLFPQLTTKHSLYVYYCKR